jgi:DNA-binding MarR family transcriptional regulator
VAAPPRISYVVGRLDRAISQKLEQAVAVHGVTLPQYTALSVLRRRSGLSNAQLARRTYVRPQSMMQVISTLEREGLIARTPDENAVLADLSAEQRDALLAALLSCVQHLGAGLADV